MKNLKRFLLVLILMFGIFIISGCGVNVMEVMKVDGGFKGERIIDLNFDEDTLEQVQGGGGKVKDFLKRNIKKPFTYIILKDSPKALDVRITLKFDNFEDYKNKVRELYKKGNVNEEVEIIFTSQKKRFYDELKYSDKSDAKMLMQHLINQAIKEKILKKENRDSVWAKSLFSFKFKDKEVIKDAYYTPYEFKEIKYRGPEQIVMTTAPNDLYWDRVFNFIFDKKIWDTLHKDWVKEVFAGVDIKELGTVEKELKGKKYIILRLALQKTNMDTIRDATSKFFDVKTLLLSGYEINTNKFRTNLEINEKIPKNAFSSNAEILSVYYSMPVSVEKQYCDFIENYIKSEDVFTVSKNELEEGFRKEYHGAVVFDKMSVTTKIFKDGSVERVFDFVKKDDLDGVNLNRYLETFLKKNEIKYSTTEKGLSFKLEKERFKELNDILFQKNPSVKIISNGFFKYEIKYDEFSTLDLFKVKNLSHKIEKPMMSSYVKESIDAHTNTLLSTVIIKGYHVFNIIMTVLVTLICIVIAIIFVKKSNTKIKKQYMENKNYAENKIDFETLNEQAMSETEELINKD